MTIKTTSRLIGTKPVDFIEVDDREVARLLPGVRSCDIDHALNKLKEKGHLGYDQFDIDSAEDGARRELSTEITSFLKNEEKIDNEVCKIITNKLESLV